VELAMTRLEIDEPLLHNLKGTSKNSFFH